MSNIDETMALVMKPLRKALEDNSITEDSIVKELAKAINCENMTAKLRALELVSKWAGWNAPEKHVVREELVVIEGEPEDLDV